MTQVKCKVKPCYYYSDGDICTADTIMVDYNTQKKAGTRMEAGRMDLNLDRSESRRRDLESPERALNSRSLVFETGDLGDTLARTHANKDKDTKAKTSEETLCSTFRPKNAEPRH